MRSSRAAQTGSEVVRGMSADMSGTHMVPGPSSETTPLPSSLYRFVEVLLGCLALCLVVEIIARRFFHLHFEPYATPFFREFFPDFLNFIPRFHYFGSLLFFSYTGTRPFMYPATMAVLYKLFYFVPGSPLVIFLLTGLVAVTIAIRCLGRGLRHHGISAADSYLFPTCVVLCSYPVWFAGRQANMEIVIWIILMAGLGFFLKGYCYSAAACFGLAAALKIYPLIYFGLLLSERRYRQIVFGVLLAAVATLGSLWLVYPVITVAWRNINAGLDLFRSMYMLRVRPEIGADHSLFALLKLCLHPLPTPSGVGKLLSVYLGVTAFCGLLLFFARIRTLPVINQILCLSIASVLLPPTSFEYTLLHLLFPLAMLVLLIVESVRRRVDVPGLKLSLGCFAVLLAFLPEIIYRGHSYGGQIKCITLLVLFVIALRHPFTFTADIEAP